MPVKAVDVEAVRVFRDGYVERADATVNKLREFRKADLRAYNALFLVPPAPKDWKSRLTAERFNKCLQAKMQFDPKELKAGVERILDFSTMEFEPYLCSPYGDLEKAWLTGVTLMDWSDMPFWETAMCLVPKAKRSAAGRKYWRMPLFN